MTRKEPQFNDDVNATVLDTPSTAPVTEHSEPPIPHPKARTPWMLWFLVVISLAVSFGMAFFGLDEAGRYQAALNQAEAQAKALEATIDRLNKAQVQGIGELAQSDAQMRQTLTSLEKRLQDGVREELKPLANAQTELDQSFEGLRNSVDERLALLAEQLNVERNRLDDVMALKQSVDALDRSQKQTTEILRELSVSLDQSSQRVLALRASIEQVQKATEQSQQEIRGLQSAMAQTATASRARDTRSAALESAHNQMNTQFATMQQDLTTLQQEIDRLSAEAGNSLALELVTEQVERLSREVTAQGELLQAVDASRKQLTQRLMDLDGQVNQALKPRE